MKASENCLALIREFEGERLTAYRCPAGKLTIGYGHTGTDVKSGMRIDIFQANILLRQDVAAAEAIVERSVKVPLTQGQFDGLVSFVFNVGAGAKGIKDGFVTLKNGQKSTMLKLINEGDFDNAARQFGGWVYGGGKKLPGLVARREAERKLFEA